MTTRDMVIETLLDHSLNRTGRGFFAAAELAGRFLDTDRGRDPIQLLEETARHLGITRQQLEEQIRQFARYVKRRDPALYHKMTGARFSLLQFIRGAAELAWDHYREKHTLL